MKVVILGPGCAQCNDLEQAVLQELGRLNIPAAVEHVTDIKEIGRYGIVRTPALVVNGKIVSAGIVPNSRRLREILNSLTKS
uniref:Thioredoxin family protein n=1 Tax=Desulfomonile tiedjei TaxID=2358 RepID=A0A7C4ATN9_9BACT